MKENFHFQSCNLKIFLLLLVLLGFIACNSSSSNKSIIYTGDETQIEDNLLYFVQRNATEETIELGLTLSNLTVDRMYGIAFDIDFDPAILEFVKYEAGDFLEDSGKVTANYAAALQSNNPGTLIVGISQQGWKAGVVGGGTLISLTFKGKSEGTSSILFENNAVKNPQLETVNGIRWINGAIRVDK